MALEQHEVPNKEVDLTKVILGNVERNVGKKVNIDSAFDGKHLIITKLKPI